MFRGEKSAITSPGSRFTSASAASRTVGGLPGSEKGPFHASGHMDGPGMEWLIDTIDAEQILPVHTQKLSWFEQRWPEKVLVAPYGQPLLFD